MHVHAHDNHGRYDDHLAPGDGAIDWTAVCASLSAVHYSGWMVLELKCPGEPLADYFRRALTQAREIFGDRLGQRVTGAAPAAVSMNERSK